VLIASEQRQHQKLLESTRKAEDAWAGFMVGLGKGGYSAVAREPRLTPEAVRNRVKKS
jgi:hypothetical protein